MEKYAVVKVEKILKINNRKSKTFENHFFKSFRFFLEMKSVNKLIRYRNIKRLTIKRN